MNISNDQVIKYTEYVIKSPFVQKMKGKGDDLLLAENIYASSAILATTKKEHETALEVFKEVSKSPEIYEQFLKDAIENEKEEIKEKINKTREEYEALPKRDEEFVLECSKKIDELKEQKLLQEKAIRKNLNDNYENAMKAHKKKIGLFTGILFLSITCFILFFTYSDLLDSVIYLAVGLFFMSFIGIILGSTKLLEVLGEKPQRYTNAAIDNYIIQQAAGYNEQIEILNKAVDLGYGINSTFARELNASGQKAEAVTTQARNRLFELREYIDVLNNQFRDIVHTLQMTLENFDAINSWAVNYIRSYKQDQHNREMLELEEERAYEQRRANRRLEDEQRRQTEAMQKQADAAEKQAREAARQAEASEEKRKRMENERWGDHYRTDI